MSAEDGERYKEKMRKRKAAQDLEVASKTIEKGLLIINTGRGKGKSTAAFGLILRALGHGWRVGVVQFIKGAWATGERKVLEGHFADLVSWHTMGEGFTWETQDRARDIAAANAAWAKAQALMEDRDIRLSSSTNSISRCAMIISPLRGHRRARRTAARACTSSSPGRNAPAGLVEAADLVTEMTLVKHHFAAGVKAQAGIEF